MITLYNLKLVKMIKLKNKLMKHNYHNFLIQLNNLHVWVQSKIEITLLYINHPNNNHNNKLYYILHKHII